MEASHAAQWGPTIRTVQARALGALPLVYPILTALQVRQTTNELVASQADIDLGQIVVLLALNRLLAPQPLNHVQAWLSDTVLPEVLGLSPAQVYDTRLGRALDRLAPHWGELWERWVARAIQVYGLDLSVLHWDLTSLYFEGAYDDSQLAAYGYSRDGRPDTKQVNLELEVTDAGQVPVLYHLLPGNTADITRPVPHLRALWRFLNRPELAAHGLRPLLVGDCKTLTPEAVFACHRAGVFYLAPLADGQLSQHLLDRVSAEELTANPLAYRPRRAAADPNFVPYQGVWRPCPWEHDGQAVTDRALIVWSAGKQRLDEQKRKTQLKRLLNGLADLKRKLNTRRHKQRAYVEQRLTALRQGNFAREWVDVHLAGDDGALRLTFQINRSELQAAQARDGRYVLVTNAEWLDAETTLTRFKGQDGVEKRFHAVKGPLRVHPLFLHTDRRLEGLVCLTLLALLVRAVLEWVSRPHGYDLTADRLLAVYASLHAVDLTWADGSRQRRASALTDWQADLLRRLDWPTPAWYAGGSPASR